MSSSSVSFRISRHTQDLAETVHALSQRLVTMEQRLEALEGLLRVLREQPRQAEEAEAAGLAPIEANIERLLQDCRLLLADQPSSFREEASVEEAEDQSVAATLPHGFTAEPQPLPEGESPVAPMEAAGSDENESDVAHAA